MKTISIRPKCRLRILIVDNDKDASDLVQESLGSSDVIDATVCTNVSDAELITKNEKVNICVFDVRFADGRYQVGRLLDLASARWPNAVICIVSNFLGDLRANDRTRVDVMLPKPIFMLQPSVLGSRLIEAALNKGYGSSSTWKRFMANLPKINQGDERSDAANADFAKARSKSRHMIKLWNACNRIVNQRTKGKQLELFLAAFLSEIDGFSIPDDGINLRTKAEELDVIVEITDARHHVMFGAFTICECKNWSTPVSWDELAKLQEKLIARRCKFGVFVALNGVTAGFHEKLKAFLRDGVTIALLTKREFSKLEHGKTPFEILQDAFYATIKYEGER